MTLHTMPDIESRVIGHLLTVTEVAAIVSDRVYAELPPEVVYPCITLRVISSLGSNPRWLEGATLEVAGWSNRQLASSRKGARDTCETAVAALCAMVNQTLGDVVVVGPIATTGPRSVPDQISPGVTNPRFIAEVSLTYHPVPY